MSHFSQHPPRWQCLFYVFVWVAHVCTSRMFIFLASEDGSPKRSDFSFFFFSFFFFPPLETMIDTPAECYILETKCKQYLLKRDLCFLLVLSQWLIDINYTLIYCAKYLPFFFKIIRNLLQSFVLTLWLILNVRQGINIAKLWHCDIWNVCLD